MSAVENELATVRRAMLADKGRLLYGKFCGTGGRGICAESFAVFHIGRGEAVVAEDLVAYLNDVVSELQVLDPHHRMSVTQGLLARIMRHLSEAKDSDGMPNRTLQQTGQDLRLFVKRSSDG